MEEEVAALVCLSYLAVVICPDVTATVGYRQWLRNVQGWLWVLMKILVSNIYWCFLFSRW